MVGCDVNTKIFWLLCRYERELREEREREEKSEAERQRRQVNSSGGNAPAQPAQSTCIVKSRAYLRLIACRVCAFSEPDGNSDATRDTASGIGGGGSQGRLFLPRLEPSSGRGGRQSWG